MHLYYRAFRLFYGSKLLHNIGKRSFNNYVGIMLSFLDHRSTFMWTFYTLNLDKNGYVWSTYSPHLVHVVFECPLVIMQNFLNFLFKNHLSDQLKKWPIYISPFRFSNRNQIEKQICKINLACPKSFR